MAVAPGITIPITFHLNSLSTGKLAGMIFYGNVRQWIPLEGIHWSGAANRMHFSHREVHVSPTNRIPARLYEGTLANLQFIGTMLEEDPSSGKPTVRTWSAAKNLFHGLWQKQFSTSAGADVQAVAFNAFEGKLKAKCLLNTPKASWLAPDPSSLFANAGGSFGFEVPALLKVSGSISGNTMAFVASGAPIGNVAWTGAKASDGLPF